VRGRLKREKAAVARPSPEREYGSNLAPSPRYRGARARAAPTLCKWRYALGLLRPTSWWRARHPNESADRILCPLPAIAGRGHVPRRRCANGAMRCAYCALPTACALRRGGPKAAERAASAVMVSKKSAACGGSRELAENSEAPCVAMKRA
jgi:hypothetical protein